MPDAKQQGHTTRWSWSTGERGVNRVRAYADESTRGVILLEWYDRPAGGGDPKRQRISLGHADCDQAKAQAEELARKIRAAEPLVTDELTVHALFDMYLESATPMKSEKSQASDRATLRLFLQFLGPQFVVANLSRRQWDRFIRERGSGKLHHPNAVTKPGANRGTTRKARTTGVGETRIRRDLELLRAVLNWATQATDERGEPLLESNPLRGLKLPKNESPVRSTVTHEQYEALLAAARASNRADVELALILAHETGHRIGAVRQLRWSDVNLDDGTITWRKGADKLRREHTVPMSDVAKAALTRALKASAAIGETWIFPATDPKQCVTADDVHTWWLQVAKVANLPTGQRLGWHSLRRKFATELKNVPLKDLAALGGWKNPNTILLCYQQPDQQTQREALRGRMVLRAAQDSDATDSTNRQQG